MLFFYNFHSPNFTIYRFFLRGKESKKNSKIFLSKKYNEYIDNRELDILHDYYLIMDKVSSHDVVYTTTLEGTLSHIDCYASYVTRIGQVKLLL